MVRLATRRHALSLFVWALSASFAPLAAAAGRAAPGIVEAQLLERFVESLAAHPDGRSDLEAEVRRHLAAVLPLLPEMSRMVEARYQASHREALDAFRR